MTRREAREAAFCALFSYSYTPEKTAEELEAVRQKDFDGEEDAFCREAVAGVLGHMEEVDGVISECAVGWTVSRISRVSFAILRLAVWEMLYMADIPLKVTINEAVELSKKYDEEKAFSFINGVLNRAASDPRVIAVGHR